MNRTDVTRGINKTWEIASKLNLNESFANAGLLPLNEEFRDLIRSSKTTYSSVYVAGLSLSHYNILLTDYSYFQFSWDRENYVRYAYYPNPFISGKDNELESFRRLQELVESGLLQHEEYLTILSERSAMSGIPMLRYENAPDQRKKFAHPCSHFHIGFHSENRWPVRRILTPYAFSLLVFKNYYGSFWRASGDNGEMEEGNSHEEELISEKALCRLVDYINFEEIEERSFYFA